MIPHADRNMMITPSDLEHGEIVPRDESFDRNEPKPPAPPLVGQDDEEDEEVT